MERYYIEYELEDGSTIMVLAPKDYEPTTPVKAAGGEDKNVRRAAISFDKAMDSVKAAAVSVLKHFKEMQADEVELKFGLTTTGELGNFAVGNIGIEANYEVVLKWKKKPVESSK